MEHRDLIPPLRQRSAGAGGGRASGAASGWVALMTLALLACARSSDATSATERGEAIEESVGESLQPEEATTASAPTSGEAATDPPALETADGTSDDASDDTPDDAPAGAADDPNHPANRVARWRASLPERCRRFVIEVPHDSGRFALATVWEGTGTAGGDEICPEQNSHGIVASWTGTAPMSLSCLMGQGELGDVDGDSRMDLLHISNGCEMSPPDFVQLVRDTESGPVLVAFPEGLSLDVRSARWFERDDGGSGIEMVLFDWDTRDQYPPPDVDPVRVVWRDGELVRASEAGP